MSLSSNPTITRENFPWGRAYIVEGIGETPLILPSVTTVLKLVKNEKYSYLQGIYLNKRSEFWELIYPTFDTKLSFMEFLLHKNIHTLETDFNKLKLLYDEFLFCNLFKIL